MSELVLTQSLAAVPGSILLVLFLLLVSVSAPEGCAAAAEPCPTSDGGGQAPANRAGKVTNLTVMTFNLRTSGFTDENGWTRDDVTQTPDRRAVALDVIGSTEPDIIGCQEARYDQLTDLDTALADRYASVSVLGSGGAVPPNEFLAIYYRTDRVVCLDWGFFALGDAPGPGYALADPDDPFDPMVLFAGTGQHYPRLVIWAQLECRDTGQPFLIYTTHYDFTTEAQVAATKLILNDINARVTAAPRAAPVILCGDFNADHRSAAWELATGAATVDGVTGDLEDAWALAHDHDLTDAGTFHGFDGGSQPADRRLDWILIRGGVGVSARDGGTACRIITHNATATVDDGTQTWSRTQYPSDHYPLLARLTIPVIPDTDGDGLPDATEHGGTGTDGNGTGTDPENPDTDGDMLDDSHDPAPLHATTAPDPQLPPGEFRMDGWRDPTAVAVAEHGLTLWVDYNGADLYLATEDTGEGSDHFIFVCDRLDEQVAAPWAKDGTVFQWAAVLAGENDHRFAGWFDADGAPLATTREAGGGGANGTGVRAATYFTNYGVLEGCIDLSALYGASVPVELYLAVAPYETADGTGAFGDGTGDLVPDAQVPGCGSSGADGDLADTDEYYTLDLSRYDSDGDGIVDTRDPDSDGDALPDCWERWRRVGDLDATADPDADGLTNGDEYRNGTDPLTVDTDDDGLPDGYEVGYGLDPTVEDGAADADDDGVSNLDEYLAGTDPTIAAIADPGNGTGDDDDSGNTTDPGPGNASGDGGGNSTDDITGDDDGDPSTNESTGDADSGGDDTGADGSGGSDPGDQPDQPDHGDQGDDPSRADPASTISPAVIGALVGLGAGIAALTILIVRMARKND